VLLYAPKSVLMCAQRTHMGKNTYFSVPHQRKSSCCCLPLCTFLRPLQPFYLLPLIQPACLSAPVSGAVTFWPTIKPNIAHGAPEPFLILMTQPSQVLSEKWLSAFTIKRKSEKRKSDRLELTPLSKQRGKSPDMYRC